jgi:hypothetical protein
MLIAENNLAGCNADSILVAVAHSLACDAIDLLKGVAANSSTMNPLGHHRHQQHQHQRQHQHHHQQWQRSSPDSRRGSD